MDDSSLARESSPATGLDFNKELHRMASDDQQFLLYFIMGTYFGPDLKGETPQKSVLQRIAEGLPPYTVEQLAGSQIKRAEVEKVYYHALRKANQSVIAKLPLLRQFFHGNILTQGQDDIASYPQFPDLFPPQLHPSALSRNRSNMFENIVFMSNPETYHIKPEDIERFKRLTGLEDFDLDREAVRLHTKRQGCALHDQTVYEQECDGKSPLTRPFQNSLDDPFKLRDLLKHGGAAAPTSGLQSNGTPVIYSYTSLLPTKNDSDHVQKNGPAMIFLPYPPTEKEWSNIVAATKSGFALTGSAARGQIGPTIGLIDIGESEDTYLFRVALPGVKRNEKEFSCVVENEGKVLLRGVTVTGEKTVYRCSQMFEMQTQNLCPTGKFSISFQLPGPVNSQQFAGNFGADGILEGVVMKQLDVK